MNYDSSQILALTCKDFKSKMIIRPSCEAGDGLIRFGCFFFFFSARDLKCVSQCLCIRFGSSGVLGCVAQVRNTAGTYFAIHQGHCAILLEIQGGAVTFVKVPDRIGRIGISILFM